MRLACRRSTCSGLLSVVLSLAPAVAAAQPATPAPSAGIYTCTDADGRVISSDRPIAVCARREMRELNSDGSLRRIIAPPMTREQEREAARREQLRRDEDWARKVQQSRDRNLLLTFEDERALESMRRRTLADIDHEIRLATTRILAIDKQLKLAQQEADAWKTSRPSHALPFVYQQRITEAANAILAEDALIRDRQTERSRIEARFEADRRRLRELLGRPPTSDTAKAVATPG